MSDARGPEDRTSLVLRPPGEARAGERCECLCGSLLARWVEGGVELKCRRCRRIVIVQCRPAASPGGE